MQVETHLKGIIGKVENNLFSGSGNIYTLNGENYVHG